MEDVIAVEVTLTDGAHRFFLTYGRIQDPVDPGPVCALVLRYAHRYALNGEAVSTRDCDALREAAESTDAPYFYEHLLTIGRQPIPFGDDYAGWRAGIDAEMQEGQHLYYCGQPTD